jgi:hypothetical protein
MMTTNKSDGMMNFTHSNAKGDARSITENSKRDHSAKPVNGTYGGKCSGKMDCKGYK